MAAGRGRRVLKIIIIVVLVIAAVFAVIFHFGRKALAPACEKYLELVESGKHKEAYDMLAGAWQEQQSLEEFAAFEQKVRTSLGKCISKKVTGVQVSHSGGVSTGTLTYSAEFENGACEMEFSLKKEGDEWRVMGVNYNSPALLDMLTCPHCGKVQKSPGNFCSECGKPLGETGVDEDDRPETEGTTGSGSDETPSADS